MKIYPNLLFKVSEVNQILHTRKNFDIAGNIVQDPFLVEQPHPSRHPNIIQKYSPELSAFLDHISPTAIYFLITAVKEKTAHHLLKKRMLCMRTLGGKIDSTEISTSVHGEEHEGKRVVFLYLNKLLHTS